MNRKTRSILALVLALAMLAAILPAGFAATAYYGDVNGDGRVNSTDARLALRAAAKLDALKEEEFKRADVNGDGLVNSTDARSVLRMAAKLEALILMPQETAAEPPTLSETAPALPETAPAQQTSQKAEIPAEQTTLPDTPSVNAPTVPEEPATAAPEQPLAAEDFPTAYTGFAARLLRQTYEPGKNILLSPLSVFCALAGILISILAGTGAKGQTLREMERMFRMPNPELNAALAAYYKALPQSEKSSLKPANSIWIRENVFEKLEESFLQQDKTNFDAEIREAPFDDATLKALNGWVRTHTDGMIDGVLDRFDPDDVMVLVNALAFRADWAEPYDEGHVGPGVFHAADGKEQNVDMMSGRERAYLENDLAQGFAKPYVGGGYSFVALLPKEGVAPETLVASLDAESLAALFETASRGGVRTVTPKFRTDYDTSLVEPLMALGMPTAFLPDADLSGMGKLKSGDSLLISDVIHKTLIEVDAAGTKAGAVTAVIIAKNTSVLSPEVPLVVLNRPFVYMIVDNENHLPVFIGVLNSAL